MINKNINYNEFTENIWKTIYRNGLSNQNISFHDQSQEIPKIDLAYLIHIQDKNIIETFKKIQDVVSRVIGNDHYYTPETDFHITLYGHMTSDSNYQHPETKIDNIDQMKPDWIKSGKEIIKLATEDTYKWRVFYSRVLITRDSVIAVADDRGVMNGLRKRIISKGKRLGIYSEERPDDLPRIYPNIIHSTLVRYSRNVSYDERIRIYLLLSKNILAHLNIPYSVEQILFKEVKEYGVYPQDKELFSVDLR